MNCPHCGEKLSLFVCPECGGETLEGGLYCCQCGKPIRKKRVEIDFSERIPCHDGSCIGTVNEKGVCNFCGKPYDGQPC